MGKGRILVVCTTDSMIWNFLVPHIKKFMEKGFTVECACSITGHFFEDLQNKQGLIMHQVDFRRSPYSFNNFIGFFQLEKIVKERGIDIIFCHEPVGGAVGRLVGHRTDCKVIYMAHGFHFYKGAPKSSRLYYIIEKFLSKYTDALITINNEDYEVSRSFKAKENYLLNGIGIDTSKFIYMPEHEYLRKELGIKEHEVILLSVGELIKRKNHETVIEAVAKLNNPSIHYVIAGNGKLEQTLKAKVSEMELKNVHLLGYRTDINRLCNSADIFIMPSFQEGLSVALMEAMACGLPVIASRIRGNVDLIDENQGGLLVDVTDTGMYVKAIDRLSGNYKIQKQMGEYNIEKIKLYDIDNVSKQLIPIIVKMGEGNG